MDDLPDGVEAGRFGKTVVFWSRSGKSVDLTLPAPREEGGWIVADVVGRTRTVETGSGDSLRLTAGPSPQYLLPLSEYHRLVAVPAGTDFGG